MMGIVVARGSAKLSRHLAGFKLRQLLFQAISKHANLFAQTCWRCRLAVRFGQHGHVFPRVGILSQLFNQLLQQWVITFFERLFQRKWHAGVIDVLRSQPKVDELLVRFQAANGIELFLNEILHGLHVVVRYLLDVFNTLCLSLVESAVYVA